MTTSPSCSGAAAPPARDLDVRPLLHAGREPFPAIMAAVDALAPGQSLRLLAPFRPMPLFQVMAERGYAASDRPLDGGDWEVVFTPVADDEGLAAGSSPSALFWAEPIEELDLRDDVAAQHAALILGTLEELKPGDVLFVLLREEPFALFAELARRDHEWAGNFDGSGTDYRLLIRHGGGPDG